MTVKEYGEKYKISRQAIYAKIKRKATQLDGHIAKSGGQLILDEFAEELLKPKCADFTLLEKLQNLQSKLDDKNSKIEKLQSQLAEQNLKNVDFKNFGQD